MNEGINLSDEYRDLARYFRLSILRERGVLPPAGLKEIEEIVERNERAAAIEETKKQLDDGNCKLDDYQKVVATHRAALAEAIKNASPNEKEEPVKEEISEEFKDLARYFRLSILRNNGQLPPSGLDELDEIVGRNERASAIEEVRKRLLNGEISVEEYENFYNTHRAALADEIKRVYEINNQTLEDHAERAEEENEEEQEQEGLDEAEEEEKQEEKTEEDFEVLEPIGPIDAEKPEFEEGVVEPIQEEQEQTEEYHQEVSQFDEFDDLARYFRLSILRNNGQLPPKGLEELDEIASRCERAGAIEEARKRLLNGSLSEENYQKVVAVQREALAEHIKNRKLEEAEEEEEKELPKKEPVKEEPHRMNISDEYRTLARYFRLSMLRDQKMLPPVGLKELEEIANSNERAGAVEEAHKQMEAGNISKESYQQVHDVHRKALADEVKRVGTSPVVNEPGTKDSVRVPEIFPDGKPIPRINPEDLERYKTALKALKAYREYTENMKKLGMTSIHELTEFLGLGKQDSKEEGKSR